MMAFYFLNKLDKSITKKELEVAFRKFGNLKFIGDIKQDKRDSKFNSTIAVFNELIDVNAMNEYCKTKKILLIEKKDNNKQKQPNTTQQKITQPKSSNISNPSFYFYKDEAYGRNIESFRLENSFEELFKIEDANSFELTTTYPGLLVGSGYNHPKLKENENDFQLGFFFDHTTGLPLISGSSIKGLLRSVFKHKEFMSEVYDEHSISEDIFEDNRTIFYDAYIHSTKNPAKKIFGSDFITSHMDGELKNPNPIKFLKIAPDVTFIFQFKCDEKYLELFKNIILDFGLGAKTNVGYGKFIS